jgi:hypothetical protein
MTRDQYQSEFVATFAVGSSSPITLESLAQVETKLCTRFPSSYISFATKFGAMFTPMILDLVIGGDAKIPPAGASFDVQYFLSVAEIVETTRMYREGGMDDEMIAIASDSMGNVFGFRQQRDSFRHDDLALLIFDHDFCSVDTEADSFDSWIASFVRMHQNTEQDGGGNSAALRASP